MAYEKIRARCNQFLADPNFPEVGLPLADDSYGRRFMEAYRVTGNPYEHARTSKQVHAAMTELADQGQLDLAIRYLTFSRRWRGHVYAREGGDSMILDHAIFIAKHRLAELEAAPPEDIRRLAWCFRTGQCTQPPKLVTDNSFGPETTPAEQQRTLSVAADIEQAVRAGDIDALMGKP